MPIRRRTSFFSAVNFDRTGSASGVFVTPSPQVRGTFYAAVPFFGSRFMAVEDNNPLVFHDKPFVTADFYPSSKFHRPRQQLVAAEADRAAQRRHRRHLQQRQH